MPRPPSRPPSGAASRSPPRTAAGQQLQALGEQVRSLSASGDHEAALRAALQALAIVPAHPVALGDVALCEMRLGRYDAAHAAYQKSLKANPANENVLDGLAECCGLAGRLSEAADYGRRALALKAAMVADAPACPLPDRLPRPFDAQAPERNLIVFTLFGGQPRYCETALLNVQAAAQLMPGWRCRFYVDNSVPAAVVARLLQAGAQVVDMTEHAARAAHPLTWRFLVLGDPGVDRFLLRDADSLLTTREVAAVQAWLTSPQWFHLMRDWFTHSELLLAGMWGGCGGIFQDVAASLVAYSLKPPRLGRRLVDQHWLRQHAWPTVRQSALAHDRVFRFGGAVDFPAHEPVDMGEGFHIGANICPNAIGGAAPPAHKGGVAWRLRDEHAREVCRYTTPVHAGQWQAALPLPYTRAIAEGRWRCELLA